MRTSPAGDVNDDRQPNPTCKSCGPLNPRSQILDPGPAEMIRLTLSALDHLPPDVARPAYAALDVPIGIVHLGIGAFHRAHQAIYTDDALTQRGGPWGICG